MYIFCAQLVALVKRRVAVFFTVIEHYNLLYMQFQLSTYPVIILCIMVLNSIQLRVVHTQILIKLSICLLYTYVLNPPLKQFYRPIGAATAKYLNV